MSYLEVSLSIPYWLPTSGMVAAWLVAGVGALLACVALSVGRRKGGYAITVAKAPARLGILGTLALLVIWPLPLWIHVMEWRKARRRA